MSNNSKLGLGGHSFIGALGNDPKASFTEQCEIVSGCLDQGIRWIDTTYYQERVALGNVIQTLGRREEAKVIAWNFFRQPGGADDLFSFTHYEPHHLNEILAELQTDYVDLLVIHTHDDQPRLEKEIALASEWQKSGRVRGVGLGMAELKHLEVLSNSSIDAVSAVLAPYNVFNKNARELFAVAHSRSITTFAMSPFIRGWKLDAIATDTRVVSDILLRWISEQTIVDNILVSMRKKEWVEANLRSVEHGALTTSEIAKVLQWLTSENL